MITDNFASLLSKSSVYHLINTKATLQFIFSRTTFIHYRNMALLNKGPKGPITGDGGLSATKQKNYRQRIWQQQRDRLKNLK